MLQNNNISFEDRINQNFICILINLKYNKIRSFKYFTRQQTETKLRYYGIRIYIKLLLLQNNTK